MGSPDGCTCVCHIPGSKVEMPDGSPCCFDRESGPRRGKTVPPDPSARPARVTAASPVVYQGRSGLVDGDNAQVFV